MSHRGIKEPFFFKRGKYVGGQHFGPLVAVVARGIAPREDVGEALRETVVVDLRRHADVFPDVGEYLHKVNFGVARAVNPHVKEGKLQLPHAEESGVEVLGGVHLVKERLGERFMGFDM